MTLKYSTSMSLPTEFKEEDVVYVVPVHKDEDDLFYGDLKTHQGVSIRMPLVIISNEDHIGFGNFLHEEDLDIEEGVEFELIPVLKKDGTSYTFEELQSDVDKAYSKAHENLEEDFAQILESKVQTLLVD